MVDDDAPHTGALIVLLPAASDPVNEGVEDAHVTMLWFGEAATLDAAVVSGVRAVVAQLASERSEFVAKVNGRAVLGDEDAGVLLVESYEMVDIRNALAMDEWVQAGYRNAESQFPTWVPHVTTAYGQGLPPADSPKEIRFGALGLWLGGQHEVFPLLSAATEVPAPDPLRQMLALEASAMIYPVDCPDDLPVAVQFADEHPDARWYVEKCAAAFNVDCIPESWSVTA